MIPEAIIVKITMKSIRGERVISSQHNASHSAAMNPKRILLPVVITMKHFKIVNKVPTRFVRQERASSGVHRAEATRR